MSDREAGYREDRPRSRLLAEPPVMTRQELAVLYAIRATEPEAYGNSILDWLNKDVQPNWLTRRFPALQALQGTGPNIYVALYALEDSGWLTSEWSEQTYAERGNRRRRYYHLTERARVYLGGIIRAVPGINRGGWDVQRTEPDGTITLIAAGMQPQQARDLAERLRAEEDMRQHGGRS